MDAKIYGAGENPKVFGRGTRVRLRRDLRVSKPMPNGVMEESVIRKGEKGTIESVFPYRVIQMDDGSELKLHRSIKLVDELEIVVERGKLRLV
jgi:hypothetical protein